MRSRGERVHCLEVGTSTAGSELAVAEIASLLELYHNSIYVEDMPLSCIFEFGPAARAKQTRFKDSRARASSILRRFASLEANSN